MLTKAALEWLNEQDYGNKDHNERMALIREAKEIFPTGSGDDYEFLEWLENHGYGEKSHDERMALIAEAKRVFPSVVVW